MKIFFALEIDPTVCHAIEVWRDRTIYALGRAVPAANFHLTLNFLGEITDQQLQRLYAEVEYVNAPTIELHMDTSGYFPAPGIFWIAPSSTPAALTELVAQLRRASRKAGIKTSRKAFQPHITLFRNYRARPMLPTPEPSFDVCCDGFVLLQSVAGRHGVRYHTVRCWPAALS